MFIRRTLKKDKESKKEYCSYQLVESYRTEKGPRQRILLTINKNYHLKEEEQKILTKCIEDHLNGTLSLIPYPEKVERLAKEFAKKLLIKSSLSSIEKKKEEFHSVDLESVDCENCRTIGLEHLIWETFQKLDLHEKLKELGFTKRQIEISAGIIAARLSYPGSERRAHRWLTNISAFDELLGTDLTHLSKKSVYQISDRLLSKKEALELHLEQKERTLFSLDETIVLYDLTNTYFEGRASSIKKAKRGHSKEKRRDCPLVTLGLVLNRHGFSRKSKIFSGNVSEPQTLKEAIEGLHSTSDKSSIIVLDGGLATEENLKWLKSQGYSYVVRSRKKAKDLPLEISYKKMEREKKEIFVAAIFDKEKEETILICNSREKQAKDKDMEDFLKKRLEVDLEKMRQGITKKRGEKKYERVLERLGRLKEKHKRIAYRYEIKVKTDKLKEKVTDITWECKEEDKKGSYFLRAYGLGMDEKFLWETYVMLSKVEEGFRALKSELGLRPIFHQIDRRVEGHFFISLLSFHIMQTVLFQLKEKDLNYFWETLRREMNAQTRITVKMKTKTGQVHIRATTNPTPFQKVIYKALNISEKPGNRLRAIF